MLETKYFMQCYMLKSILSDWATFRGPKCAEDTHPDLETGIRG